MFKSRPAKLVLATQLALVVLVLDDRCDVDSAALQVGRNWTGFSGFVLENTDINLSFEKPIDHARRIPSIHTMGRENNRTEGCQQGSSLEAVRRIDATNGSKRQPHFQ